MTSENDNNIKDEDLEYIAGIIKFILILNNSGKEIYCNYFTKDYDTIESQLDFEYRLSKISKITAKYSEDKTDIDIFNFETYNIICKIEKEIAIFIGQDENDNEILLEQFFKVLEI